VVVLVVLFYPFHILPIFFVFPNTTAFDDCPIINVHKPSKEGNAPVPNGDGLCHVPPSRRRPCRRRCPPAPPPKTGLALLVDNWIAGDQKRINVVAKYGKIENWNMKFVTNLKCVFSGAKNFNANLSQWDVSHLTTLEKGKFFIANY